MDTYARINKDTTISNVNTELPEYNRRKTNITSNMMTIMNMIIMILDIDIWLNENSKASIDDFVKALVADEEKYRNENKGVHIDDHLISYISSLENVYFRKYSKQVDYMGLVSSYGLTQEQVFTILLEIIKSGESFFSGYMKHKR
ncbi:MAG: hypothetical protein FWG88_02145 [Oscillospiraceae bacterium]|nr:hypothetical protein [Oscillospiraceae bacterium]